MKILVTGNAGFIGYHVASKLLAKGLSVVGIDNVNDYYDTSLKDNRLTSLQEMASQSKGEYQFVRGDIADRDLMERIFSEHEFTRVIHLAAQPGVRYSLENPRAYTHSNIDAFLNVLECCRHAKTAHLVYASSSSVYGANQNIPFTESDGVDHPLSLYAATKRANELMAHSYSHLYALPVTGLRFFTVYGPWGRPDMAPFIFTRNILEGHPIQVFNNGEHSRDFTYIDDIVDGVIRVMDDIAAPDPDWNAEAPNPAKSAAPFRIFNIGNSSQVKLGRFIKAIETCAGKEAIMEMLPLQPGDIVDTYADVSALEKQVDYKPSTDVEDGVRELVDWYRNYYQI